MLFYSSRNACAALCAVCAIVLLSQGCGNTDLVGADDRATFPATLLDDADTVYETDDNDLFEDAAPVDVSAAAILIRGDVETESDVDVFDLGPVLEGERILVELTSDSDISGAMALFDDTGAALLVNDHRNVYLGKTEPFVDVTVPHDTDACFVAVSATPGYGVPGEYGLVATRTEPEQPAEKHPADILLVFSGGDGVKIGNRPSVDVPRFDAATISDEYKGQTDEMIKQIVAMVREDYAGFDVNILSTSEGAVDDGTLTRVYYGTYDPALLGVADGVDEMNGTAVQEAIIFTDTFQAFLTIKPTETEMCQAIANVTSHEVGHLLGLVHTADPAGIMDVTASLYDLVTDQIFRASPIDDAVFPIGMQDAPMQLLAYIGGDPTAVYSQERVAKREQNVRKAPAGPPARAAFCISSCCGRGTHH